MSYDTFEASELPFQTFAKLSSLKLREVLAFFAGFTIFRTSVFLLRQGRQLAGRSAHFVKTIENL